MTVIYELKKKETRCLVYAQFLGENGSLGYYHHQCYYLLLVERPNHAYPIAIFLLNGGASGHCYYVSRKKFEENWSIQNTYDEVKDPLH